MYRKSYLIILKNFLIFYFSTFTFCFFGMFFKVDAAQITFRVYTIVDNRKVPLENVVIAIYSPFYSNLFDYSSNTDKTPFVMTDKNGEAKFFGSTDSLLNYNNNFVYEYCSDLLNFSGLEKFFTISGIQIGGIPKIFLDKYGINNINYDSECSQLKLKADNTLIIAGFISGLNNMDKFVKFFSNKNISYSNSQHYYRFVPYFPSGYRETYLRKTKNLALKTIPFADIDPKGLGRFIPSKVFSNSRTDIQYDTEDFVISNVLNYPDKQIKYLGKKTLNSNVSESIILREISDKNDYLVEWEWFYPDIEN